MFEIELKKKIVCLGLIKLTNAEVLKRISKKPGLINDTKSRKLQYFGHVLRGEKYRLLHWSIRGKICGKRSRGRPRTNWLQNLGERFQCDTEELFGIAKNEDHI